MSTLIQFKRVNSDEVFSDSEYIPEAGEPVFNLNSNILYIGDGEKRLSELNPIGGSTIGSINILNSYMESGALNTYYEEDFTCDVAGIISWRASTVKVISPEVANFYTFDPVSAMCDYATGFNYSGGTVTEISRLPNGMTLDRATGKFYGTPIESGTWYITITATIGNISNSKVYEWSVN